MDLNNEIIECISKNGKVAKSELNYNTEIFASNIVTSLGLLEIVSFLENKYKIIIQPEELIHDNFGTVGSIIDFINKKINSDV